MWYTGGKSERGGAAVEPLCRDFYLRDVHTVARELLGKTLIHRTAEGVAAGIIVEVEAYNGATDKGAHSYPNKRTARTAIQFGPGGFAYVYAIYGLHYCFNVVAGGVESPEAVLVRALRPVKGLALMQKRRGVTNTTDLCNGPGKLCQALAITRQQYGADLCGSELYITEGEHVEPAQIMVSPRIHIEYAEECQGYLWRYFLADDPCVSKVPKQYRDQKQPLLKTQL